MGQSQLLFFHILSGEWYGQIDVVQQEIVPKLLQEVENRLVQITVKEDNALSPIGKK
jgi:hypothetical protein